MPKVDYSEKRLFPRKELRTQVIFEDELGEGFIYFYSTDVSVGGLFIESEIPLRLGTKVFLSFKLHDDAGPLQMTGEIIRLEKERGGSTPIVGMGIRFLGLSDDAQAVIEAYVKS